MVQERAKDKSTPPRGWILLNIKSSLGHRALGLPFKERGESEIHFNHWIASSFGEPAAWLLGASGG